MNYQFTDSYVKLYACCILVNGAKRSSICDIQRSEVHFVPSVMFEILTEHSDKLVKDIYHIAGKDNFEFIDEYMDFLLEKELAFLTDEPLLFPSLSLDFETPSIISNAIVEISSQNVEHFDSIIKQLEHFNCKAVLLNFYNYISFEKLGKLIEYTNGSRLRDIQLILPYITDDKEEVIKNLGAFKRLSHITFHSSPHTIQEFVPDASIQINFEEKTHLDSSCCGVIHKKYFSVNI